MAPSPTCCPTCNKRRLAKRRQRALDPLSGLKARRSYLRRRAAALTIEKADIQSRLDDQPAQSASLLKRLAAAESCLQKVVQEVHDLDQTVTSAGRPATNATA